MIHEYAVDPACVASWTNDCDYRYFLEKFGIGTPRILSLYPRKHWERLVNETFERLGSSGTKARPRLEELVKMLKSGCVKRPNHLWDPKMGWPKNVMQENSRIPFEAIISNAGEMDAVNILRTHDLAKHELWDRPFNVRTKRDASVMSDVLKPLLKSCGQIFLIDPYIGKRTVLQRQMRSGFVKVLEKIIRIINQDSVQGVRCLTIITQYYGDADENEWNQLCNQVTNILPNDFRIFIKRFTPRAMGQDLHNRYLLTDLGGVNLGHGFDETPRKESYDDFNLLSEKSYSEWWQTYVVQPTFDEEGAEIRISK